MFSHRIGSGKPNRIALAESQALDRGIGLGRLNDSNPTRFGLGPETLPGVYGAEPRGPVRARRSLAAFLTERDRGTSAPVDPDDIYLLSSTSQAYSWLMKLLCDPGDIILAPRPGYPLIESIACLESVRALPYRLEYDGSWLLDLATIREVLEGPEADRVRALVLINPNNPTGSYLHPLEREELMDLCARHGVVIIADEVFFDYPLDPLPGRERLAGGHEVLTFGLDGFSKILAAPQAKVGWIQVSGPASQVVEAKRRLDLIADDYLPMSQIIADGIPSMLQEVPEQTGRVGLRIRDNLNTLKTLLAGDETPVSLLRAEAGWNTLLRFPATIEEDDLIVHMIQRYGITGQPGYFFDMPANGFLALSLLPETPEFQRNVRSILSTVNDLIG